MSTLAEKSISKALFISPIVNMEKLIADMMLWANVTEDELQSKKEIPTAFGETLSWEYLCYVRKHPIKWNILTCILYGGKDHLTSRETISEFAEKQGADLTVMETVSTGSIQMSRCSFWTIGFSSLFHNISIGR